MLPLNYANICTALLLEILQMYGLCINIYKYLVDYLKMRFYPVGVGCTVSEEECKSELT